MHLAHAGLRVALGVAGGRFEQRVAQHRERGLDLAAAALLGQHAEDFPHVFRRLEVLAAVARVVAQVHEAPGLQLLQAHAHVGARELQQLGDLVGIERALRQKDQRVDLPDGAVDAPLAAHLAEVGDELAVEGREFGCGGHAADCRAGLLDVRKFPKTQQGGGVHE
ncbi:hypothetical protein D9M72_388390 [compost metagenome]